MLHAAGFRIEPPNVARIVEALSDPDGARADGDALRCVRELSTRNRQRRPSDDDVVSRIDPDNRRRIAVRHPERTFAGCKAARNRRRVGAVDDVSGLRIDLAQNPGRGQIPERAAVERATEAARSARRSGRSACRFAPRRTRPR